MCDACVLQAGADAAGDLLEDVFRVPIAKALNPLNHLAFVTIIRRVARELRSKAAPIEERVLRKAQELVDADWPRMTARERAALLAKLDALMRPTGAKLLPGVTGVLKTHGDIIVGDTRKRLVQKYDFGIQSAMDHRDKRTVAKLVETQALFVRNNAGLVAKAASEKARTIVSAGLERGLGRDDIAEDLGKALTGIRRPDSYWNLIAGVFSNRARTFTQLHSFEDAGIRAYTLMAVLDEVTTDFCRMIDGTEFPVDQGVERIKRVQDADDPEEILKLMPWARVGQDKEGRQILYYKPDPNTDERRRICIVEESGVGQKDKIGTYSSVLAPVALARGGMTMPPFHGNCRTTVMPVF